MQGAGGQRVLHCVLSLHGCSSGAEECSRENSGSTSVLLVCSSFRSQPNDMA